MRIALVTNQELWHKYWICKLYNEFDVKLILHPNPKKNISYGRLRTKILEYGNLWAILKILSIIYNQISTNSIKNSLTQMSEKYFSEYEAQYSKISKEKIYDIESINSESTLEIIKNNNIDIICNLGGDIYKKEIINSAKVACFNFHSGISPFYNGNKTIFHAVSDFRPNFAGGTLMYMNERIDGGNILSHYLVPIETNDIAADLFMKNIKGSVKLYAEAIKRILNGSNLIGIPQKRSFKYLKNIDWTLTNDLKLKYYEKSNKIKRYTRNEKIIDYYDGVGDHTFQKTLNYILKNESDQEKS